MTPPDPCFEHLAHPGLDGPIIAVEVEMVWQNLKRLKPGWVHMQTGEVQLREGEYWCEHPKVNFQKRTWGVEMEIGVWNGKMVSQLRKLSSENLKMFCDEVRASRAAHLDSAIAPPDVKAVLAKPRF